MNEQTNVADGKHNASADAVGWQKHEKKTIHHIIVL